MKKRCPWCGNDPLYIKYHDEEWGVPVHDDKVHFEFLVLESAQAGLSWKTILSRRDAYRKAYDNFDYDVVAGYGNKRIESLIKNSSIIRNRMKIESSINNAKRFLDVRKEYESFDDYIWSFVKGKSVTNRWKSIAEIPPNTELSDKISSDLKMRGFKFVGSTIIYSHLQATGIINDHLTFCFRYKEISSLTEKIRNNLIHRNKIG